MYNSWNTKRECYEQGRKDKEKEILAKVYEGLEDINTQEDKIKISTWLKSLIEE